MSLRRQPRILQTFYLLHFTRLSTSQTEINYQTPILLNIFLLQVVQQSSPLTNHLQQPPPRVVVCGMFLEVLGQILYPPRQQRYLYLRRACVVLISPVLLHDCCFCVLVHRHYNASFHFGHTDDRGDAREPVAH